jgi:hypothetical protein
MKELVAGAQVEKGQLVQIKDNKVYPVWESTIPIPKYTTRLQDWVALSFKET